MKGSKIKIMNESAVSEAVGFILIFGIMLTGIGLITLYGYPMLLQEQQNTNTRNMERNMILLQSDVNSLVYKSVPYKETTMQVSGGTLQIQNGGIVGSLGSNFIVDTVATPFQTNGMVYTSQDQTTTISLENGAVHTSMGGGSAMLSEPRWYYDEYTNTFVMTFITMTTNDYLAQTGIGTVRMELTEVKDPIDASAPSGGLVAVHYVPDATYDFSTSWANYFNSPDLGMTYNSVTGNYELPIDAKVIIKQYTMEVLSL